MLRCGPCEEGWWRLGESGVVETLSWMPLTLAALVPGDLDELGDEIFERRSCEVPRSVSLIAPHTEDGRESTRQ